MKINVLDLRKAPKELDIDLSPVELRLASEGFSFPDRVAGRVRLQLLGTRVIATGRLETVAASECGRCLGSAKVRLKPDVMLVFEKRPSLNTEKEEEVLAADWEAQAREIEYYDEEILDPTESFRQVLLLELPNHPVCKADCPGLCPHCGADLNQGECGCGVEEEVVVGETDWKSRLKKIKLT